MLVIPYILLLSAVPTPMSMLPYPRGSRGRALGHPSMNSFLNHTYSRHRSQAWASNCAPTGVARGINLNKAVSFIFNFSICENGVIEGTSLSRVWITMLMPNGYFVFFWSEFLCTICRMPCATELKSHWKNSVAPAFYRTDFLQHMGALCLVKLVAWNAYEEQNSDKPCTWINEKETYEFYGLVKSLFLEMT